MVVSMGNVQAITITITSGFSGAVPTPLQAETFCSSVGGQLISDMSGILIAVFFFAMVAAILLAASIEALPMTGWWNAMGYSMMGKIPVAILFVFIALSLLAMADGTMGLSAPSCVPLIG